MISSTLPKPSIAPLVDGLKGGGCAGIPRPNPGTIPGAPLALGIGPKGSVLSGIFSVPATVSPSTSGKRVGAGGFVLPKLGNIDVSGK